MIWLECIDCRHVFTDGYFGDDLNEALFSKSHPNQTPGYNIEIARAISARIVERVCPYVSADGVWLDVGFGDGALLTAAQEFGFKPYGLDLRQQAVDGLARLGIEARCASLPDYAAIGAAAHGSVKVISLADVLEHEPYPKKVLSAARQLLHPEGVLFVSCPNMGCSAWHQLTDQGANPYWIEIEHFHNFTRERLSALLAEEGFRVAAFSVSERYRLGMELIALLG